MTKKRARNSEPSKEEDNNSDRISKLPDCLIHHILSFIPTVYAVRTSLLSKRWRRMWISVPALRFPYMIGFKIRETRETAFNAFVERCLNYRRQSMRFVDASTVATFELKVWRYPKLYAGLSKWVGSHVIMNNVKDLDLCLFPEEEYTLPSTVLNGRSLTHLKLKGNIKISASCSVNLPSLKSLGLRDIWLDNSVLNNLLIWCPSLEKCILRYEFGRHDFHIRIPNLNLSFLQIYSNIGSANIEASSIQTLKLLNTITIGTKYPKFDFCACKAIRDLTIGEIYDSEVHKFEDHISKLPHLKSLRVHLSVGRVNISSQSLEHLYLYKSNGEEECELKNEAAIDAPNLVSLCYEGPMDIRMSMGLLNHHAKGKFFVWGSTSELIKFFSNVNPNWISLDLSIRFHDKGETKGKFELPENLREISLPTWDYLKHLHVKVNFLQDCTRISDFRDFLKRLAPSLETLSIE